MKVPAMVLPAGAFGAVAPNLIGMTQQALYGHPDPVSSFLYSNIGFLVGTLGIAVLGLGIAFFYEEKSPRRAVALGAAAPALVLGWAQGANGPALQHASASGGGVLPQVVTVAHGADAPTTVWASFQQRDHVWVLVSGLATGVPAVT